MPGTLHYLPLRRHQFNASRSHGTLRDEAALEHSAGLCQTAGHISYCGVRGESWRASQSTPPVCVSRCAQSVTRLTSSWGRVRGALLASAIRVPALSGRGEASATYEECDRQTMSSRGGAGFCCAAGGGGIPGCCATEGESCRFCAGGAAASGDGGGRRRVPCCSAACTGSDVLSDPVAEACSDTGLRPVAATPGRQRVLWCGRDRLWRRR